MSDIKKQREANPDAERTTVDVERKVVSDIFDNFDKDNKGEMDPNELPALCQALNVKPWHVIRYVKVGKGESKVTKKAFMEYWFDPNRPKPVDTHKKAKKKATKADVVKAFSEFKKALSKLEETCLSAF